MFTSATHAKTRIAQRARTLIAGAAAVVIAGAALAACSGAGSTSATETTMPHGGGGVLAPSAKSSASAGAGKGAEIGIDVSSSEPLIVRTGNLTLRLKPGSVTRVFDEISGQANALDGFVSSSSTTGATAASLVLRVPSNDFSKLVDDISGDGHTLSEQLNGQDVTGESINLRARITNLDTEEASLRTLMSRAGTIGSILDVQDQLFTVEGEIEQLSAQESSLVDQATYATVTVTLETSPPVRVIPGHPNAISRAISLAGRNTVAVGRGIVLLIGWVFPAAVLALLAGGALFIRRRRRLSGTGSETDSGPAPASAP